jgi:radical SAM superfamily enzyme YgiQ (UPF0313 family)
MRICLITPPSPFLLDERVFPALGILKVGAVLERAGHQVDHLDLCGVTNYERVLADYSGANVFAVTATTPQIPAAIRIAQALRLRPDVRTVLGGPHSTLVHAAAKRGNARAQGALDYLLLHFDVVVAGDGEKAIFTALNSRGLVDADDPKGVLWNTSKDFDESPWPARHLVDMESYHYRIDGAKATSMIAQLGCLTGDTPIVLSSGREIRIDHLKVGDFVICYNGNLVSAPIQQVYQREADDIWEIEWGNGQTLRITGEHPIYTRDGWKTVAEVEPGTVSAYLSGMRYCFSSSSSTDTGEVLFEAMPFSLDEAPSEPEVAGSRAGEDASALRGDDAGGAQRVLRPSAEKHTESAKADSPIEDGRQKPHETPGSSGEGVGHDQTQMGKVLLGSDETLVGERSFVIQPGSQTLYWSKSSRANAGRDSDANPSRIRFYRQWGVLDRPVPIGNAAQPGFPLQDTAQGYPSPRRALAHGGISRYRGAGLFKQGVDAANSVDRGIEDEGAARASRETPLLWSSIRSKRFIGRGTVYNITVHPGHNYFASGMLVHNCPFHCKFCGGRNSPMLRQIRVRPSNSVVDEMMHLHENYGMTGVMHFQDELNVNHRSLVDLMVKIKETGIPWQQRGFVKAELFNEEQAEAMYAAGFRWLLCGFESAHPRILKNIAKNATREDNTRMLRIAHKHGIKVKALMSAGHPGESEETILATRDWLMEEKPDDFDVTIITVYPGTPYHDSAVHLDGSTYVFETNGDNLYSEDVDFTKEMAYYKGVPGDYRAFVWTDFLSRERLAYLRDEIEDEVRKKLGIPYATAAAALNYEHSVGMSLPQHILRSRHAQPTQDCR